MKDNLEDPWDLRSNPLEEGEDDARPSTMKSHGAKNAKEN